MTKATTICALSLLLALFAAVIVVSADDTDDISITINIFDDNDDDDDKDSSKSPSSSPSAPSSPGALSPNPQQPPKPPKQSSGMLPSWLKSLFANVRQSDVDGLKEVARDVLSGKIKTPEQLKEALERKAPNLVAALRNLKLKLLDALFDFYERQNDDVKKFLREIFKILKKLVKQVVQAVKSQSDQAKSKQKDLVTQFAQTFASS